MKSHNSLPVVGTLLVLHMVATSPSYAQAFEILSLLSPNEEEFGFFFGVFGASVSDAGGVNQDGMPDLIVGAYQEDPGDSPMDAGRAHVFVRRRPRR